MPKWNRQEKDEDDKKLFKKKKWMQLPLPLKKQLKPQIYMLILTHTNITNKQHTNINKQQKTTTHSHTKLLETKHLLETKIPNQKQTKKNLEEQVSWHSERKAHASSVQTRHRVEHLRRMLQWSAGRVQNTQAAFAPSWDNSPQTGWGSERGKTPATGPVPPWQWTHTCTASTVALGGVVTHNKSTCLLSSQKPNIEHDGAWLPRAWVTVTCRALPLPWDFSSQILRRLY